MAYKIGTRVKKVRGIEGIGTTATVVEVFPWGDMRVKCDIGWIGCRGGIYSADVTALTPTHLWEPILDRHEPCEAEFKESLDELLSRENSNETVK